MIGVMQTSLLRPVRAVAALLLLAAGACDSQAGLRQPSPEALAAPAPDSFTVVFETSQGTFEVLVDRAVAPNGADRVHYLADHGFFEGGRFFRINPRVVQFGYSGEPALDSVWRGLPIQDEPVVASNLRGAVSFARAGPNTRDFQLFINRIDNPDYDTCCGGGYPPIGRVVSGMEVVDALYDGYGEPEPGAQDRLLTQGNDYLRERYPLLDSILSVRVRR